MFYDGNNARMITDKYDAMPFSHNNKKWISDNYCLPSLQEPTLEYISSPNEYYMKRQIN